MISIFDEHDLAAFTKLRNVRKLSGTRILITGSTGMVGNYLSQAIAEIARFSCEIQPQITLLVRDATKPNLIWTNSFTNVCFIEAPLSEWSSREYFDYVIHAASPASPTKYSDAKSVREVNVGLINSVIQLRIRCGTFLFVSSGEVYGVNAPVPVPEDYEGKFDTSLVRAVYPLAKLEAEKLVQKASTQNLIQGKVARLFHTFGAGMTIDDGRSFADFIWGAILRNKILMRSSGDDVRTFLHLRDSVSGLITYLLDENAPEVINIGSSVPCSIKEFASAVSRIVGAPIEYMSTNIADKYESSPNSWIVPDNEVLSSLGWHQELDLEKTIQKTVDWCKAQIR